NYDTIEWEAGSISGGNANCIINPNNTTIEPPRAGFGDGATAATELLGSGVAGAFLDTNPTGLIHNSLNSSQLGRYRWCFGVPSCPPDNPPPTTLADYGIQLISDPGVQWTSTEELTILQAAEDVTEAYSTHFLMPNEPATFKQIMIIPERSTINFKKTQVTGSGCETNNNVSAPLQAEVTCLSDTILTKYTVVHELGHVFVGRTGGYTTGQNSFFGRVQQPIDLDVVDPNNPTDPKIGAIYDNTGVSVLLGAFKDSLGNEDWVRGIRGWGSWASPLPNPTDFQQNPLNAVDANATQAIKEKERDEGAADMFLNWVYSTISPAGFRNVNWGSAVCHVPFESLPESCNDDTLPGDHRLSWMNTTMTDLLSVINP
ncbi:MAG: hypothetical protein L0154_03835, partial [Chloroflexi bacterium]|nr:hypothetical protein [Chloroflexota bacterium]